MGFKCSKCKKECEWFGSIMFPCYLDYNFCNKCGNDLNTLFKESENRIFNEYIQPERSKREDGESRCGALNIVETQ